LPVVPNTGIEINVLLGSGATVTAIEAESLGA
jgi:hypothetical protein